MSPLTFFVRLFVAFNLRHLRHHRGRAVTVLLGIALGAAVFTSVRLSVNASLASFTRSVELLAGKADRVVVRSGGDVPEHLVADLLRHPGVRAASPVLTTYVRLPGAFGKNFLLIGIDPILDRPFRTWTVAGPSAGDAAAWIDLIRSPDVLLAGEKLLERFGWQLGDRVHLEHARQTRSFRIAGRLSPEGLAGVEGGRVAILDIATFQEFTGRLGVVDRIDLMLAPGKDPAALDALLPAGAILAPPSGVRRSGRALIRAYQINLSVLSFASLFVGMFLV